MLIAKSIACDDYFQMFERLRQENPDAMKKIVPIVGDLTSDGLGMLSDDEELLIETVSIVIHGAATLRLEAGVKDAVLQNTIGTKNVMDLCLKMKKLEVINSSLK